MSPTALSAEAKATRRENLVLEMNARKDKLFAMCEAQCASLRSRLERRVLRVPSSKRTTKLIEIMEPVVPPKPAPTKKPKESAPVAPAQGTRRTRPTPAAAVPVHPPAPKPASRPASRATTAKPTRGTKRASDDISADDKENNAELTVPKKRTKTAPAPRAPRATRAASKKVDPAPQVLSPKTNNARPAPQTRTRRQR